MEPSRSRLGAFIVIAPLVFISTSPVRAQVSENALIVFHAGSLSVPFERILDGFRKEHPRLEVFKEIAGSRECARKISDLRKPCDIFASADYLVIDSLLIPSFADWNLKFATNEMVIVYGDKSRRSNDINRGNWFDILLDDNIPLGRSDPNADPCGYRTIFTLKLAEMFYHKRGLADQLLIKNPEYVRPKEVDLLSLLEAGELDYVFLYRSVAEQHHLKYLSLPDSINLKNAELEDVYRNVTVVLSGKKPGETITQVGGSIVYGVTIPNNAPHPELAKQFIHFLLNKEKGLKIMEQLGQPTVVPSACDQFDKLPDELKHYATKRGGRPE